MRYCIEKEQIKDIYIYVLKFGFWKCSYSFLTFEPERYGNKQKKEHANNEAACSCDIVTERFDPIRNKGNDLLLKDLTENFIKQKNKN